jgi:hypothetical protein
MKAKVVMQKYNVIGIKAVVPAGILIGLNDGQYKSRKQYLSEVEKGIYQTESGVEFKKGEIISLCEVNKAMVSNLELVKEKE